MSSIGFTGTQSGWKNQQMVRMHMLLNQMWRSGAEVMHNGDCVGSDLQAAEYWHSIGGKIYLHPPDMDKKRAFFPAEWSADPLPYLKRNQIIVTSSKLLIATPGELEEQLRSGTWATIRYARRIHRPIIYVWPDGSVSQENHNIVDLNRFRQDTGMERKRPSA